MTLLINLRLEHESQQHEKLTSGLVLAKRCHPSDIVKLLVSANPPFWMTCTFG